MPAASAICFVVTIPAREEGVAAAMAARARSKDNAGALTRSGDRHEQPS
jgi:hypothetical protein